MIRWKNIFKGEKWILFLLLISFIFSFGSVSVSADSDEVFTVGFDA